MHGIVNVRQRANNAIKMTNSLFGTLGLPISISRMTKEDLNWCVNRSMQSATPLAWRNVRADLNRVDSYNFCFKLTEDKNDVNFQPNRLEGACACFYNDFDKNVTIEMIQSFDKHGGPIDGKMMAYSLITLIFFLYEVNGYGVCIDQPVNEYVANYYIEILKFKDISGDRSTLYRSLNDLLEWYQDISG